MARLFLDPGVFDRRAVLEEPVDISDGAGGATRSWRTVRTLSIHLTPVSADHVERFDRGEVRLRHRVICRKGTDLKSGNRLSLDGRILCIETAHDPDETGRFIVCLCVEEL